MGRFYGPRRVEMTSNYESGRVVWETLNDVQYLEDNNPIPIVIPAGTKTDGASIPWILTWLFPAVEYKTFRPALLHDTLLNNRGFRTRANIDGTFKRALKDEGVGLVKRYMMWAGVRIWATLTEKPGRKIAKR